MSLFETLKNILDSVDEKEYPEICQTISENMDLESGEVFDDAYGIAQQLHEADGAKLLPNCVSAFLLEAYAAETENGNTDAACNLGALYYTGRAGEQNFAKAVKYYTLAADGGCCQAQENLAYCYYYGRAGDVDYEKAFHYFALGAFDGHIRSLYKIGDMYRYGQYVTKNACEAFRIYARCFDTMHDGALPLVGADVSMRIADCFFEGIGTAIDYEKALEYYQRAERLFYHRLQEGDYRIKSNYEKVIARQEEARRKMRESLPKYDWVKSE